NIVRFPVPGDRRIIGDDRLLSHVINHFDERDGGDSHTDTLNEHHSVPTDPPRSNAAPRPVRDGKTVPSPRVQRRLRAL
ncbi:MAG: hypothetical protein AAF390_13420, partial [Pseudomonadota bacterium]